MAVFHLVNSLLPEDQNVTTIPHDTPVMQALVLMEEHGFSQVPVMTGDTVIGVFSHRSLSRRMRQLGRVDLSRLDIDDCLEELQFVRLSGEIEELFRFLDRDDAVLVGDRDNPVGVATSTDLVHYLYGVAHPFVLIQEIELVLRGLVRMASPAEELGGFIARAVGSKYRGRLDELPTELASLDLGELVLTIIHGDNYSSVFERVFGRNRDSTRGYLNPIPQLRNDVFHFRGDITSEDYGVLANTRAWLLRKALVAEARGANRNG